MDTEAKLSTLHAQFPQVDVSQLLEILVACDGSVEGASNLLEGQFGVETRKRKEVDTKSEGEEAERPRKLAKPSQKIVTLAIKEDLESRLPNLVLVEDFLPRDLANQMLASLVEKKPQFKPTRFYIAGQKCESNKKTAVYKTKGAKGGKSGEYDFFPELKLAAYYVEERVNEELKKRKKASSFAISSGWTANLCVANVYDTEKQMIDWHSDKLTLIGPLPTIASLSFGATRVFRVRKIYGSDTTMYNIPLPHNTLLVMLPGIQEEYKHCVPSYEGALVHKSKVCGSIRFNLTFRMIRPEFQGSQVPDCPKCGSSMVLKRMFKRSSMRGYYFWLCNSKYSGHACSGFYYGKFEPLNGKMYTSELSQATRWLAEDDNEAEQSC